MPSSAAGEAGGEVAPVDFGFGVDAGDAEDETFTVVPADADGGTECLCRGPGAWRG